VSVFGRPDDQAASKERRSPRKQEPSLDERPLDSRPGLLSAGVTFFRGNDERVWLKLAVARKQKWRQLGQPQACVFGLSPVFSGLGCSALVSWSRLPAMSFLPIFRAMVSMNSS
jgi:hypothetical protein